MHKKFFLIMAAALLLTGCGDKVDISSTSEVEMGEPTITDTSGVTLGDYTDTEVEKPEPEEVTSNEVTTYIDYIRNQNSTLTEEDGEAEEGDTVVISYEGGDISETSVSFSLDEDSLPYPEFTDIAGHKAGDEFTVTAETDSGDVEFSISLESVSRYELPELTDEFVQSVSSSSTTVKEYKKEVRKMLEEQAEEAAEEEYGQALLDAVVDASTIDSYDEDMVDFLINETEEANELSLVGFSGYDSVGAYLEEAGMTEEEYADSIEDSARATVKEKMVVQAIADKEGISISEDEYNELLQAEADEDHYTSVNTLVKDAAYEYYFDDGEDGEDSETVTDEALKKARDEYYDSFLKDKVIDLLKS